MITQSLWRLEFSEAQQCFHQDTYPCRHEAYTNGYFTLFEKVTDKQISSFIQFVRANKHEYISKDDILFWRDIFLNFTS